MKRLILRAMSALFSGALLMTTPSLQAHHSFAAEFDINRPIVLEGTVTRMEWSNPHSWVHLEVVTNSGDVQQWKVEGGAPNALIRRGWNRDSLPAGTKIRVEGYQARDRSYRANGRDITMEDGSQLFVGSSGAGAPDN